jgi:hypothetical protein
MKRVSCIDGITHKLTMRMKGNEEEKKSISITQRKAPTYEVKCHSDPDNHRSEKKAPAYKWGRMPPNEIEKSTQK